MYRLGGKLSSQPQQDKSKHERHAIINAKAGTAPVGGSFVGRRTRCGVEYTRSNTRRKIYPHYHKGRPSKKLHHSQTAHCNGHCDKRAAHFSHCFKRIKRLFFEIIKFRHIGRRIFRRRFNRSQNRRNQHQRTNVKRIFNRIGDVPQRGFGADADSRQNLRQKRSNYRPRANHYALHSITRLALRFRQNIPHKCAERLHTHVDRCIQYPQGNNGHPNG